MPHTDILVDTNVIFNLFIDVIAITTTGKIRGKHRFDSFNCNFDWLQSNV